MEIKIPYAAPARFAAADTMTADGEIGRRFDIFAYERISSDFAIREILKEAEDCIRDKYDDENVQGLWRCEFWGKQILSAVRVCRMKEDARLKEEIRRSVYRVLSFQNESGYLGSYKDDEFIRRADPEACRRAGVWDFGYNWSVWGTKYTLWALLECALLLDDENIVAACRRMADQLIAALKKQNMHLTDAGVMHGLPAGSLMKPMLLLYRLTGEQAYLDLCLDTAAQWEKEDEADAADPVCAAIIAKALTGEPPAVWYKADPFALTGYIAKAYEMMSCFDGLVELYRVTGTEKYLRASTMFWDSVKKDEQNILGSVGYCERFVRASKYPDCATEVCDAIHWMRLCYELFRQTGESKYMDAMEKAYLNAFLAGVWEDGKSGAFFVRSAGRHWSAEWQVDTKYQHCCVNNAARGFVNAAESAIMMGDGACFVNQYFPIRSVFGKMSIRVSGGYTDKGVVMLTVRGAEAGTKLKLRMPAWSASTEITVIGGESRICTARGGYETVILSGEDQVIRLRFDMTPEIIDFKGDTASLFGALDRRDYHVNRWCDAGVGMCDRTQMMPHPMSVIRRGPVMLARSKRLGSTEEEMFSGETVWGKERTVSVQPLRHDRFLSAVRVTVSCKLGKTYVYDMCDAASAANRDLEEVRFFTMYI